MEDKGTCRFCERDGYDTVDIERDGEIDIMLACEKHYLEIREYNA